MSTRMSVPNAGSAALRRAPTTRARPRTPFAPRAVLAEPPSLASDFGSVPRPDGLGRYGRYGGKYVPETLIAALEELESKYKELAKEPAFKARAASRHYRLTCAA